MEAPAARQSVLANALRRLDGKRSRHELPSAPVRQLQLHLNFAASGRPARAERRAYPRRISRCTVTLCAGCAECSTFQQAWALHNSRIKGRLQDISRNGLCMTLGRALEPGQTLCLKIENPLFNQRLIAIATVVRQQSDERGNWKVMCRFAKPLEFEQIEFFGRHLFTARVV